MIYHITKLKYSRVSNSCEPMQSSIINVLLQRKSYTDGDLLRIIWEYYIVGLPQWNF